MSKDKSVLFIYWWRIFGTDSTPVAEYPFDRDMGRKHRFDWAFPDKMVAVEIDGGQYAFRGGRHNTDKDREKMNIAAMLGWKCFRFSPKMLNDDPESCIMMVKKSLR